MENNLLHILPAALAAYAISRCILAEIFPVEEAKALETLSAKTHGDGIVSAPPCPYGFIISFQPPSLRQSSNDLSIVQLDPE